jgi:hypothetical protein
MQLVPTLKTFQLILNYYISIADANTLSHYVAIMMNREIHPDADLLHSIVQCLVNGNKMEQIGAVMKKLLVWKLTPHAETLRLILLAYAKTLCIFIIISKNQKLTLQRL